jgi:single-strand DNA-binding protein
MPFTSPANSATLIGRLTRDPEPRVVSTSGGERSVLTLGLAVRRPITPEGEDAATADFFDVTVWGQQAETCARYLRRGRLAAIAARLEPTSWEAADGSRRRGMEIIATRVEFLDRAPREVDVDPRQPHEAPVAA